MTAPSRGEPREHGRLFWAGAVTGWAIMAMGIVGLMSESARTKPADAARWALGAAAVHDLLIAPVVILLGLLVARLVPPAARAVVQSGFVVSAIVVLFAYPFVRGFGRQAANPSILPRNYATGLAVILGLVWTVAAIVIAVRRSRARHNRTTP